MWFLDEYAIEVLHKSISANRPATVKQPTERAQGLIDRVRNGSPRHGIRPAPEAADLLTQYACGQLRTEAEIRAMFDRLEELVGDVQPNP